MKTHFLPWILVGLLAACGGETDTTPTVSASAAQAASETAAVLPIMNLDYTAYRHAANTLLKTNKTGLQIPDHIRPTPNSSGSKNLQHDLADGLTLAIDTDTADKIQTVRIVWQSEKNPSQNEQLAKGAAALLTAVTPDDKTIMRDAQAQMNEAVRSNQASEFVRWGNAYKIVSTNLPSVVLTAKPE